MDKKTREKILAKRELIKYSANRAYFGKLTGAGLSDAYAQFKHSQDWPKPITSANVVAGKIDGTVICRALWHEMSYNPLRFGKVSPFLHNGREDIYHFCRAGVSETFPAFHIVEKLRHKMIGFMMLNGRSRGQWYDKIDTHDGRVTIKLVDGHSDDMYKLLSMLREMIRIITSQNLEDFKRKNYCTQMLTVISKRHPNGSRDDVAAVVKKLEQPVMRDSTPEELAEDRMDKAEESAQITASNRKYVPFNQYKQARSDLAGFANIRNKQK